jgi:hypothetical protein
MSETNEKLVCGVVMPISSCDGCSESHWSEILDIINESVEEAGFEPKLVSNADDVGLIHKRIVQNLYDNPIVVCDVSGKNPNVMFELGLRLAFDKPTVIIKDDKTTYSFDTSGIEHLEYPRDLRFATIVEFKAKLTQKIKATHQKSVEDPAYSTFLKNFGEFTVAKIDKKEVTGQEFMLEELRSLRSSMQRIEYGQSMYDNPNWRMERKRKSSNDINVCMVRWTDSSVQKANEFALSLKDVLGTSIEEQSSGHKHLIIKTTEHANREEIEMSVKSAGRRRMLPPQLIRKNNSSESNSSV